MIGPLVDGITVATPSFIQSFFFIHYLFYFILFCHSPLIGPLVDGIAGECHPLPNRSLSFYKLFFGNYYENFARFVIFSI